MWGLIFLNIYKIQQNFSAEVKSIKKLQKSSPQKIFRKKLSI
jgi:hypothetical protein